MDTVFPLKSKKTIKAINQAISHNNAMMRLKMQNALYQQELNKANAALVLAQQQEHEAKVATELAQRQQHESALAAFTLAQRQQHASALAANKKADEVVPSNANKQEPVTTLHNKKSSKFSKLLSNMNKHH